MHIHTIASTTLPRRSALLFSNMTACSNPRQPVCGLPSILGESGIILYVLTVGWFNEDLSLSDIHGMLCWNTKLVDDLICPTTPQAQQVTHSGSNSNFGSKFAP